MHLRNFPQAFVKDGKRRLVYYSAEARDLRSLGWAPEQKVKEVKPKAVKEPIIDQPAEIKVDIVIEESGQDQDKLPDFEFMTKVELLQYALARGVDLPNNALKAELIEACKKL